MDNNNTTQVEMTAEELEQFQAFKQEQAKRQAQERVELLEKNYKDMVEKFVNRTIQKLRPLSEKIRQKKEEVLDEASALSALKQELLELNGKNMPKSHQYTSAAGDKRVTIGVYETDAYDDTVEEGIAIVKEYIESLASDERSAQLVIFSKFLFIICDFFLQIFLSLIFLF